MTRTIVALLLLTCAAGKMAHAVEPSVIRGVTCAMMDWTRPTTGWPNAYVVHTRYEDNQEVHETQQYRADTWSCIEADLERPFSVRAKAFIVGYEGDTEDESDFTDWSSPVTLSADLDGDGCYGEGDLTILRLYWDRFGIPGFAALGRRWGDCY
jgi:hypothetical protein